MPTLLRDVDHSGVTVGQREHAAQNSLPETQFCCGKGFRLQIQSKKEIAFELESASCADMYHIF